MSSSHRTPRRGVRPLALGLVVLLVAVGGVACQPGRTPAKDRVVLLVHGYSALGQGTNCASSFGTLSSSLRRDGFTGPIETIGFYDSDTNCSVDLRDWDGGITNSSSWKTLSAAFSRYVHETYTRHGIPVDVVGHSMGGLIARGAVLGSRTGQPGFSAPLLVEDAVTLGTPHRGAAWYAHLCFWGQCSQLKPGAGDLDWLAQDGDPQGAQGTEWTVLASTADDVTPVASGLAMTLPDERKVTSGTLEHSDYQQDATSVTRTGLALSAAGA